MTSSNKISSLAWIDAFRIRCGKKPNLAPIHVEVVGLKAQLPYIQLGNELLLHEVKTEQIILSKAPPSTGDEARGDRSTTISVVPATQKDGVNLPMTFGEKFLLFPRFPSSHCFQSVQEILEVLPAVSQLIYPLQGFEVSGVTVRDMERLKIVDQVQDSSTGTEMLSVHSMKTERDLLLPAALKRPFVQLSNDCFKCTSEGLKAADMIAGWKPGQPPFKVMLCAASDSSRKSSALKKDKKERKHLSWDPGSASTSCLSDRWLIPSDWWDEYLYMKPLQKIRVANLTHGTKDLLLPDSLQLTVKLISSKQKPAIHPTMRESGVKYTRVMKGGVLGGPQSLKDMRIDSIFSRSGSALLLMVTDGTMATPLRQKTNIVAGNRIVVYQTKKVPKLLMTCTKGQRFLVDMNYAGTFRMNTSGPQRDMTVEDLLNVELPCDVLVTSNDSSLGYDQLKKREAFTVDDLLTETTLIVSLLSANGIILSEKRFEIPMQRSDLSVRVLDTDAGSYEIGSSKSDIKALPSVEMISVGDFEVLKHYRRRSAYASSPDPAVKASRPPPVPVRGEPNPANSFKSDDNDWRGLGDPRTPLSLSPDYRKPISKIPPKLPPKPEKYKINPLQGYPFGSYNQNNNSNNLALREIKNRTDNVNYKREKRVLERSRRTPAPFIEEGFILPSDKLHPGNAKAGGGEPKRSQRSLSEVTGPSLTSLSAGKTSSSQEKEFSRARTLGEVDMLKKMTKFEDLHFWFAPYRADAVAAQSITGPPRPAPRGMPEKPNIGTYASPSFERERAHVSALKNALRLIKPKKAISMENPGYEISLEPEISDSSFNMRSSFAESEYEFAGEPCPVRTSLSSVVDDENYEEPLSACEVSSQNRKITPLSSDDENLYMCMQPYDRIESISSEENYEEEYERSSIR